MLTDLKRRLKNSSSSIRSRESYSHDGINKSLPSLSPRASNVHTYNSSSSSSSSSSSISSMPPTPPSQTPSNISVQSDLFLNHTHLKPGSNASLLSYEKTINMYRENARQINDINIQWNLATFLYQCSQSQNSKLYLKEAVKIFKSLAFKGHAEAQYDLANIYASGQLSPSHTSDFSRAFPLFLQASKHQHPDAAYRLAATLNHPGAMYRLGLAEIRGELGLKRNVRDGYKWLNRSANAATRDYPQALHELGLLHEKGLDDIIFKDTAYSVQLYAKAAELGYAPSGYRLGQCFEFGYLACPKDAMSSVYYYTIAARQGHAPSCLALSAWYLVGDGDRLQVSEKKALEWAQLAAEKGLSKAQFALGYFTEMGIGREKDVSEAMGWYEKAAENGDRKAMERLKRQ